MQEAAAHEAEVRAELVRFQVEEFKAGRLPEPPDELRALQGALRGSGAKAAENVGGKRLTLATASRMDSDERSPSPDQAVRQDQALTKVSLQR
jgi:hypothetical protein